MNMDIEDGLELIKTAYKSRGEDKLWDRWLVDYARMDNEHFISFVDYLRDAFETETKVENKELNIEQILKEAERIKNLDQKGGI